MTDHALTGQDGAAKRAVIDITGHRRPASYYRQIVFGLRADPYLAVQRPETHGRPFIGSPWAWSDSIASWTWPGWEGKPVTVEVYSDADEVELLLNDDLVGRAPAGPAHLFRARFDLLHEPGELCAVAYRNGVESGRCQLASAQGPVTLTAEADRPVLTTKLGELGFVTLTLTDPHGTCWTGADRPVHVEVSGTGELIALGSAAPQTQERFDATERHTYDGRALAIVRPTAVGEIHLLATAPRCEAAETIIQVE
ncbi:DUF4982 domain-containing protein [Streptomyces mirabilis]|uniref:DUF4982 domain-containing protein n=1 Tax=Streptomyces mirabilis TaxID=68239 RepID=UPI00365BF777